MDRDGRIPKVALPDDVPNPERWRYLPEGRIAEGSIVDRFLTSTFAVPLLFFEGDIGVGGGISLTDIDFRTQRRREFATTSFTYTTEGQQNYSMLWRRWLNHRDLPGGGVIQEERSFVQVSGGYRKTLTRRYFGEGPGTVEAGESSYTSEVAGIGVNVQKSLPNPGDNWVVAAGVRAESRNLNQGFVESLPNTSAAFPEQFADGDSLDRLLVQLSTRYDTRDSQQNPYSGWQVGAWVNGTPLMTDGRSGLVYGASGSLVVPVPNLLHDGGDANEENPPTDVIAVTAQIVDSNGDLPFWAKPTLGGRRRLRGYVENRWSDNAYWFAAAEYRFVTVPRGMAMNERVRFERFGAALFYELGAVGPDLESLDQSTVRDSYGFSFRVNLERAAIFRFDLGLSDEGSNFTATYGLSF